MADVFISYKKEDAAGVELVAAKLREEGFSVWWDNDLTPRTAWDAALEREIAAAATVVVLWTPRSVNSDWVRTEAHYGQDRGKLIPVMLETCAIPLAFMLRQTVKLTEWRGDRTDRQWRKLLTWIADLVATKPGNANLPQALVAAQHNPYREAVGYLASGDRIVDGAFVNASTPAGTAFRDGETMPVMRILPGGAFLLGSPDTDPDRTSVEVPQRRVEIPVPIAMGIFPVLVSEYQAVMHALPQIGTADEVSRGWFGLFARTTSHASAPMAWDPAKPITYVSYDDAQAFVGRLTASTGHPYRIPSEAEWEYACRAGSQTRYTCGDTIDKTLAVLESETGIIAPGTFPPNAFGLYDMHGNVREWTADLWHESYDFTPLDGSPATQGYSSMRVVRGGGWSDSAAVLRSAARMRATQQSHAAVIGFRVVRALT